MITGVANKKIAATDCDAMCIAELTGPAARAGQTGHHFKLALAGIETFQSRVLAIEQVDTAIRSGRDVGRELCAAETSACLAQRTAAAGLRSQRQTSAGGYLNVLEVRLLPTGATIEQPEGWVVRRRGKVLG